MRPALVPLSQVSGDDEGTEVPAVRRGGTAAIICAADTRNGTAYRVSMGMPPQTKEKERKYDLPERAALPDLRAIGGVADPGADQRTLDATYYDVADFRLARAGVTLRHRTGGDDGWQLKVPVAGDTRRELHAPLSQDMPAGLADLVLAYTRGQRLQPVAHIRTRRRTWRLARPDGSAELTLDDVSAHTLGSSSTVTSWRELEVEIVAGEPELLDAIDHTLDSLDIRPSSAPPKLLRLLGIRPQPDTQPDTQPLTTAADRVAAYLRDQVAAVTAQDPGVRLDEPDAVHQMRVATRRLRSTLRAYRRILPEVPVSRLNAELKWLGAVLGPARDAEVLHERLSSHVDDLPDELVLGRVRGLLTEHFSHRQSRAREELLEVLRGQRYLALLDGLATLETVTPLTVKKETSRALRKQHKRMIRAKSAVDSDMTGRSLHELRNKVKRYRYTMEALGKPVKPLKKLQQVLGEHQDSVVARTELRTLGAQAHLAGENGFTFGLLHGIERSDAERARASLPKAWRRARQAHTE